MFPCHEKPGQVLYSYSGTPSAYHSRNYSRWRSSEGYSARTRYYRAESSARIVRIALGVGLAALLLGMAAPASAERVTSEQYSAQTRPRIVIRPHYPGPNAKRYCHFWLARESRPSGPVITPQQHCWWQ